MLKGNKLMKLCRDIGIVKKEEKVDKNETLNLSKIDNSFDEVTKRKTYFFTSNEIDLIFTKLVNDKKKEKMNRPVLPSEQGFCSSFNKMNIQSVGNYLDYDMFVQALSQLVPRV